MNPEDETITVLPAQVQRTLVVEAAYADLAARLCAELAGQSGAGMFTTGLSPSGDEPATHFVSSGVISSSFDGALKDPWHLYGACTAHDPPVEVTMEQCTDLIAASHVCGNTHEVTDEEGNTYTADYSPFDLFADLGLALVRSNESPPQ